MCPTSILKRGATNDVGSVVTLPAGLPSAMVSDEKPFQHLPPGNQHGHSASGWSSVTDTNLDGCPDTNEAKRDSWKDSGDINLGLYDFLDDAFGDFEFGSGKFDNYGNPPETAAKPPD